MTRQDQKTLCMALAFVAVAMKGKERSESEAADEIRQLANLIDAFCVENIVNVLASASADDDPTIIDRTIERHISELRDAEETHLPDDKALLIKLYDRLQHRKARRMQRNFYAVATEAKLADLVLRLLDEEIADMRQGRLS